MDSKYPGTIRAITTDSEVSNLSFRQLEQANREIPIGYESWNTGPFCKINGIRNCTAFFAREFTYNDEIEQKWWEFRAKNHQIFLQDTVNAIREVFPSTQIFTHQIAVLEEESHFTQYRHQDLASPQWTAFVDRATPGFTVYTYAGDKNGKKKKFIGEVQARLDNRPWGFLEFNTAEAFPGTKGELAAFTKSFLENAQKNGVRVVAPLSWNSNSLDNGIRDNGVADGIRQFIEAAP